jgi:hypothetical protein
MVSHGEDRRKGEDLEDSDESEPDSEESEDISDEDYESGRRARGPYKKQKEAGSDGGGVDDDLPEGWKSALHSTGNKPMRYFWRLSSPNSPQWEHPDPSRNVGGSDSGSDADSSDEDSDAGSDSKSTLATSILEKSIVRDAIPVAGPRDLEVTATLYACDFKSRGCACTGSFDEMAAHELICSHNPKNS